MEIKILTQARDLLVSVERIFVKRYEFADIYVLCGLENGEQIDLGFFKSSVVAERVLLNIVRRYNVLPQSICIIPEDDEDIMNRCDVSALPGQVFDV